MATRSTSTKGTDDGSSAVETATPDTDSGITAPKAETEEKPGPVEDKDSGTAYLNVSGGPLVYTKDGHMVDADGWTPATSLDAVGKHLREKGYLKPKSALGG